MALAGAVGAWKNNLDHKKLGLLILLTMFSHKQWKNILFTEVVGKTLARKPILKMLKDLVDKFGRSKLPILPSITPPLIYLTEKIKKTNSKFPYCYWKIFCWNTIKKLCRLLLILMFVTST
jgi:hypothetical protein